MGEDFDLNSFIGIEPELKQETTLKTPKMYRVIIHNDDYTTMDFVIRILISVFHKPGAEATSIMLDVHKKGAGICGVYTHDIAVTKINQVQQMASQKEFPLKCSLEEA